jgi:hypothetical protein
MFGKPKLWEILKKSMCENSKNSFADTNTTFSTKIEK